VIKFENVPKVHEGSHGTIVRNAKCELWNAGKIQKNLENDEDFKTPLQQKLDEFGEQLSKVSLSVVFILD